MDAPPTALEEGAQRKAQMDAEAASRARKANEAVSQVAQRRQTLEAAAEAQRAKTLLQRDQGQSIGAVLLLFFVWTGCCPCVAV